jgi:hypothetical protein
MSDESNGEQDKTNSADDASSISNEEAMRERLSKNIDSWHTHSDTCKELSMLLSVAVPLWIARLLERGGAKPCDFIRVAGYNDELGRADVLLLSGSKNKGEVASFFNKLAESMAVLSFCPGGIELFDLRFESALLLAEWQRREEQAKPQTGSAPPEGEVAAGDGSETALRPDKEG